MIQRKKYPSTTDSSDQGIQTKSGSSSINNTSLPPKRPMSCTKTSIIVILQIIFIITGVGLFFDDPSPPLVAVDTNQRNIRGLPKTDIESPEKQLETYARMQTKLTNEKNKLTDEKNQMNENLELVTDQLTELRKQVQLISHREVLEKYGEGPYRIEMQLDFPHETQEELERNIIVIELAPLDLMPTAIYHFLEMIRWKLWDGCAFHRNAGHVVQAGPVPPYAGSTNTPSNPTPRRAFNQHKLLSIPFQEYSAEYPHVKYTIGLAGRPGGPDWYISTVDNTRNHGPGGQTSYKVVNEADPCFGKVVKGFEVVDKLLKQPVKPGGFRGMKENVGIVYMKLISSEL